MKNQEINKIKKLQEIVDETFEKGLNEEIIESIDSSEESSIKYEHFAKSILHIVNCGKVIEAIQTNREGHSVIESILDKLGC